MFIICIRNEACINTNHSKDVCHIFFQFPMLSACLVQGMSFGSADNQQNITMENITVPTFMHAQPMFTNHGLTQCVTCKVIYVSDCSQQHLFIQPSLADALPSSTAQ